MKKINQKIQAYKIADAKQQLYLIPLANALVVVYYLVVGTDHPAFIYSCITLIGSLAFLRWADLDRSMVLKSALLGYCALIALELLGSGMPILDFGFANNAPIDIPVFGLLVIGLIGIMPLVYLGVKIVMSAVLIRLIFLVVD